MDNVNQPQGRDPHGHQPTQPFRFTPGRPAPGYGQVPPEYGEGAPHYGQEYYPGFPGQPGQRGGPYQPKRARSRRRALRWGAGVTAAALLGAGGALAGLKLAGNSPVPVNTAQATALNSALSPASSASCQPPAGSSSGSSSAGQSGTQPRRSRMRCHSHRLRLLREVRGMYGEVAFHTQQGTETLAFERGTIKSVNGNSVVVSARDGTTWTWTLVSDSIIKKAASTATSSALSAGERVFVGGQLSGSTRDIRLILVRGQAGSPGAQPGSHGKQPASRRSSSSHSPSGTFTLPSH